MNGVHDVVVLLQRLIADTEISALLPAGLLLSAMIIAMIYWQRVFIATCLQYALNSGLGRPLASAIFLLAFATILDFGHGRIISSLEEYAEISAGFFMLVAAYTSMSMAYTIQKVSSKPRIPVKQNLGA